ncbi:Protein phosphatase 2C [Duganella sp. CF517]|uniref:PP2C family serine/threonine-protein phosphatase n=1 Tax=Duganella sp. CF517 TaxID=1881038 RepID=UPI0008BE969C|nr:PP2C family serine/threonine-protein phosphatase [Duganella sp. CF517]SEN98200.1 Protein phosphatase 2C [Duganella sp. CF517]
MGFSLSWFAVGASVAGTSHISTNRGCEDSCWFQTDSLADGPFLAIFVADGAGSASHGGVGAELAMQAAAEVLADKVAAGEFGITDELAVECVLGIRMRLESYAAQHSLVMRDLACTFLGIVALPQASLAMQIGDGGIVLNAGRGLELAIIPMSGEYANMTSFVTDENAVEILQTREYLAQLTEVAVFSDGLQRIALQLPTNTPHPPFFSAFFDGLRRATPNEEESFHLAVTNFLNSERVNARTDDDKTLVVAIFNE